MFNIPDSTLEWLQESQEPWTRYRTLLDLTDYPADHADVKAAHCEMLAHPQIQQMIVHGSRWESYAMRRHNDAGHPLYALGTCADFGLSKQDDRIKSILDMIMPHVSQQGVFQSLLNIPRAFGGTDQDQWAWVLCDAPTLLSILLRMGATHDPLVKKAVTHLTGLVDENGWHCVASPELGKFRGPGRKSDPCPIANVYALKALAQVPELVDCTATRLGVEMLLQHWDMRLHNKYYLFGMGTDFRKIKYPFIWYDILHVVDVLSQFPFIQQDRRFQEMVEVLTSQADDQGRFTAGSMYQAWKGWSFADKKNPSPWLTFLVMRIIKRIKGNHIKSFVMFC